MKVNMNTALQIKGIGATIVDAKMPTKTAYKFMKLLKAIEEEETFFNDKSSWKMVMLRLLKEEKLSVMRK